MNNIRIYDEGAGPTINLLLHDDHYTVITTLPGFFEQAYYCVACQRPYNNKRQHVLCGEKLVCWFHKLVIIIYFRCTQCYEKGVCDFVDWIPCRDCKRFFNNQTCYDNHKKEKDSVKEVSVWKLLYCNLINTFRWKERSWRSEVPPVNKCTDVNVARTYTRTTPNTNAVKHSAESVRRWSSNPTTVSFR